MSMAAMILVAVIRLAGVGQWNPASVTGLICLGPALDLAFVSARSGRSIYALAAIAGAAANLFAFAVRLGSAIWFGNAGGGRGFLSFWPVALACFVAFGALAGLVSALAWFRAHPPARSEE